MSHSHPSCEHACIRPYIHRQFLQTTSPKPLTGFWPNFTGMILGWSSFLCMLNFINNILLVKNYFHRIWALLWVNNLFLQKKKKKNQFLSIHPCALPSFSLYLFLFLLTVHLLTCNSIIFIYTFIFIVKVVIEEENVLIHIMSCILFLYCPNL